MTGNSTECRKRCTRQRRISFSVFALQSGGLLDDLVHPNPGKYPGQRVFVVSINGYAWLVSYVESDTEFFLKTAIPSRKATRRYIRRHT